MGLTRGTLDGRIDLLPLLQQLDHLFFVQSQFFGGQKRWEEILRKEEAGREGRVSGVVVERVG
eukprot:993897-Rhodomonas_salina.2